MAGISQRIDPRIVERIQALAGDGVRDVNEMKRHIHVYVKNSLFRGSAPPPKSNKRFCPSKSTLKDHMYNAVIKQSLAKVDQANLIEKIKVWRAENEGDFFEFRPYVDPQSKDAAADSEDSVEEGEPEDDDLEEMKVDDGTSNKGLLFIHQTSWQRRLLNRYGNELSLLDATYRTTKYSLRLYFLVVKTSMEYKVVASFVTQSETTDAVKEALSVIRKWNPDWAPKHFMDDYAEEEISAVEDLFPGTFDMSRNWKYRAFFVCLLCCCCFLKYALGTFSAIKLLRNSAYRRKQLSACLQLQCVDRRVDRDCLIFCIIIHQIFSLAHDWSKQVK